MEHEVTYKLTSMNILEIRDLDSFATKEKVTKRTILDREGTLKVTVTGRNNRGQIIAIIEMSVKDAEDLLIPTKPAVLTVESTAEL